MHVLCVHACVCAHVCLFQCCSKFLYMHAVSACVVIIGVSVCVLQLPNYMKKYNVALV